MPPQSAMNGQSLPQSAGEGLPGQHGISSIADGAIEAAAMSSPIDACLAIDTAIAGRTIGASASPPIASKAKKNPRKDRSVIASTYHSPVTLKIRIYSRNFHRVLIGRLRSDFGTYGFQPTHCRGKNEFRNNTKYDRLDGRDRERVCCAPAVLRVPVSFHQLRAHCWNAREHSSSAAFPVRQSS